MKKPEQVIYWALVASLLLPLGYTAWTMYPAQFGKTILFQIGIDALLAVGLYLVLYKKRSIQKLHPIDCLLIGFTLVSLVSSALGHSFWHAFWGDLSRSLGIFNELHFVSFYFLVRNFVTTTEAWKRFIAVIVGVAAVSSVIALIGNSFPVIGQYIPQNTRISGLVGNPIFFANYLIIPIFLGVFAFFYFTRRKYAFLWLIGHACAIVGLFFTRSRGAFIGLAFGAVLAVLGYVFLGTQKKYTYGAGALLVIIGAVVGAGFFSEAVRSAFPLRLQYIYSISVQDSTAQTRLMAWEIALKGFLEKPVLGNGENSFRQVFSTHYNSAFLDYSFQETVWDEPHNYALRTLATRGIAGFGLYAALLLGVLFALFTRARNAAHEAERVAHSVLMGGVVGYATALLFSFETANSWQLWFVLLALSAWIMKAHKAAVVTFSSTKKAILITVVGTIAVLAMYGNAQLLRGSYYTSLARDAALLHSPYLWNRYAHKALDVRSPLQYDQAVHLTQDLLIFDAEGLFDRDKKPLIEIGPGIEHVFTRALEREPNSYWFSVWLAQIYTMLGEYADTAFYDKAEVLYVSAHGVNVRRQQVQLLLSKQYLLQGRTEEGIKLLEDLVAQDDRYPEPHWYLGLALLDDKQTAPGLAELIRGERHGITRESNIYYLIDVYAEHKLYERIVPLYKNLISQELNLDNALLRARLAATYVALEMNEEALAAIEEAVALDPNLKAEAQEFIELHGLAQ